MPRVQCHFYHTRKLYFLQGSTTVKINPRILIPVIQLKMPFCEKIPAIQYMIFFATICTDEQQLVVRTGGRATGGKAG